MARTAVVLFNLGGPDRLDAVRPFLTNLFGDPAIIALPQPLRWLAARALAGRRAAAARLAYGKLGGGSPLLANTEAQARVLEAALGEGFRCFVAMRYWHPMSEAAARAVAQWGAERIVLLPLYPQFSTTTTGSSLAAWDKAAAAAGITAPSSALCCYPRLPGFVAAVAELTRAELAGVEIGKRVRILLSAHGLPEKIVRAGDPYQRHVEATATALAAAPGLSGHDIVVCYQSRVGPLAWIGPATDEEIRRAGQDGVGVVVVPIAFVSEHSETLIELDDDYRRVADAAGVPFYRRVATVGTHPSFIAGLADLVRSAAARTSGTFSGEGTRLCPEACRRCLLARPARRAA